MAPAAADTGHSDGRSSGTALSLRERNRVGQQLSLPARVLPWKAMHAGTTLPAQADVFCW